jgi:Protein of unknown function (DUF3759)
VIPCFHDRIYGGGMPREREGIAEHHELGKELLASFAAAEVDKHFQQGGLGHLDRERARFEAQQQAHHLWNQRPSSPLTGRGPAPAARVSCP